jgi:hypothetical protein
LKRYTLFTARFALVPIICGPFVVSTTARASGVGWAHMVTGFATIYLIVGLLLMSMKHRQIRLQAIVTLPLGLLEAVPGMPQLHAVVSPVLFAALAWAVISLPSGPKTERENSRWILVVPVLILLAIVYGVGYRHKTSGFFPHIGTALTAAGLLLGFCTVMNERRPANPKLRAASNLMIAAVLFQVVFGIVVFIVRLLEIEGGLLLTYARTAHITGAAVVLAASAELAIQYRRSGVEGSASSAPAVPE